MVNEKKVNIVKEGNETVMRINCFGVNYSASIAEDGRCMANVISNLIKRPVSRVILEHRRNHAYNYEQTQMLVEIGGLYNQLMKQREVSVMAAQYGELRFVLSLLLSDPIGAYVELKRLRREVGESELRNVIEKLLNMLGKTKLVSKVVGGIEGYVIGNRELYKGLFRATVMPNFVFTRLMAKQPLNGKELDSYKVDNVRVSVFEVPEDVKYLYHIMPREFVISEDKYDLLDQARRIMSRHEPREEEFVDPERMRQTFFNIGRDLIVELSERRKIEIELDEVNELADMLVRYTVGFGFIEVLLKDKKIQDVVINGPIGETPIFIVHEDYGECVTNIIPSSEDGLGWASRLRMLSGRPLDEANPVLDTELLLPGARTRVAVVGRPLNPWGLGYALRRHRDMPWTLPLFIKNRMINSLSAGLISFLIDGSRTLLVAGTRSSGKTSLLGSYLVEIMRKYRIITIEDSVTEDSEVIIKRKGKFERIKIGNLINNLIEKYGCWYNLTEHEILGNDENIEIYSMDKKGKIKLSKISKFIRHKVKKPIYEITTRTGRKLKVTGDHSLFSLGKKARISEIKGKDLKKGSHIAVPRVLPGNFKDVKCINLLEHIDKLDKGFFVGEPVKEFLKENRFEVKQIFDEHKYSKSIFHRSIRESMIPVKILKDLACLGFRLNKFEGVYYKHHGCAKKMPVLFDLDEDLLTFLGLWLADGCYDKASVILSVEEENREILRNLSKKYGFNIKMHSDTFSLMANSSSFRKIMKEVFGLKGNSYTKRIPEWVFSLSNKQISYVLKGIFSGDGCVSDKEIVMPLSSLNMLKDVQLLLLRFGIIFRIGKLRKDKTYNSNISTVRDWKLFKKFIGILPKHKKDRLDLLCDKISTHCVTDVIPLVMEDKKKLCSMITNLSHHDYVSMGSSVGRRKLNSVLQETVVENEFLENVVALSKSDLLWDQVKEIKKIDFEGYVYDVSVPEDESFVVDNIVAHNTLELPVEKLRKLGYNVQPMKVRAAMTKATSEMAADEGIRTSLRMGDSSLIVGEIRSKEAAALYEAMRIGALANVVAGTIHGDSPYGVFDRVVNDLKVPRTSFKATDIIFVCNPVKSPDGLHSWKRLQGITEVRKGWEEDPLREKGFVDLMKYNPKTDELEVSDDLVNGDSEVLKGIAGNVKEWVGDWNSVWDNILLRSKIKETLVKYSEKSKNNEMLEAGFTILSNDMFHKISDNVLEEVGGLDNKMIFSKWDKWLKEELKKV